MAVRPNADRLTALYREYMERIAHGERLAPDAFCAQYPEEAPWLRPMLEPTRTASPPPPPPAPTALFDGRYRLVRELGRGGFGRVALMQDTEHNDRLVALKLLDPGFSDKLVIEYFRREIDVLRDLGHPDIPNILNDRRTPTGEFYFTMEFAEGRSLEDIVTSEAPLRIDRVLRLLLQLLDVLVHTHKRGVIHRDLKPSNIIITHPGTEHEHVKVLDFGVAKVLDDAPVAPGSRGTVVGTRDYMAPEQVLGEAVDERSDLFAVGVMAFRMLTGKFPYEGADASVRRDRRLNADPQPLDAQIPYEMRQVLSRLMLRERDKRPSTVETRRMFAALAGEKPADDQAAKASFPVQPVLIGAGALAAAAVAVYLFVVPHRPRDASQDAQHAVLTPNVPLRPLQVTVRDQNAAPVPAARVIVGDSSFTTNAAGAVLLRVGANRDRLAVVAPDAECYRTADSYPLSPADVQRGQCVLQVTKTCATLAVQSKPAGARVSLDDGARSALTGAKPVRFDRLAAGTHRLRFDGDAFVPRDTSVVVSEGETVGFTVALQRQASKTQDVQPTRTAERQETASAASFHRTYTIRTSPGPAQVFLDGESRSCTDDFGSGSRDLKAGRHRFVVRANGSDSQLEYDVRDGDTNTKLVLDFQTGTVTPRP